MLKIFILLIVFFTTHLDIAVCKNYYRSSKNLNLAAYYDVDDHPDIPAELKDLIIPYLLPYDHPMRAPLELIFSLSRVTYDFNSFKEANFIPLMKNANRLFGYHENYTGYIIKALADTSERDPSRLANRVIGAWEFKRIIKKYGMSRIMIPEKFILPLPVNPPSPIYSPYRKGFVVVENRINILNSRENRRYWNDPKTWSSDTIKELFILFSFVGLSDINLSNMGLTVDLKHVAFFDTEYYNPVSSKETKLHIRRTLPPVWQKYWDYLSATPIDEWE